MRGFVRRSIRGRSSLMREMLRYFIAGCVVFVLFYGMFSFYLTGRIF